MIKMYILLILILLGLSKINSKEKLQDEKIDINIISLELPQVPCIPNLSTFLFNIKAEFSKSPDITNILSINLSPNLISSCYAFENTSVTDSFFQCKINTVNYPIDNINIYLPLDNPNSEYYNFLNWKETIGKEPEISNKISDKEIYCIPKELNSYEMTEIKSEGCSNNKNIISLKGQWKDNNLIIPKNYEFNFDKIKGKCNIISLNWIQCEIEGEGIIKFNDNFYFEYGINTFMIQKSEKSINIKDCNKNDDVNFCLFIFPQKIFLFLILLFL